MRSDGGLSLGLNATIPSGQSLHVWVTSKPAGLGKKKKKGVTPSLGPMEERKQNIPSYRDDVSGDSGPRAHGVLWSFVFAKWNMGSQPRSRCRRGPASPAGLLGSRAPSSCRPDQSASKQPSTVGCAAVALIVILSPLSPSFLREPTVPREKLAE